MRAGAGAWIAAVLTVLAFASPASATVRSGSGSDPAGDAVGDVDARDIVRTSAEADDAGAVSMAVELAAVRENGMYVLGRVGTKRAGGLCEEPYVQFVARPSTGDVFYGREGMTLAEYWEGEMDDGGDTITLSADDPDLAEPFDCVVSETSPDLSTTYDLSDTRVDLKAPPSQPGPPPPPPPAPQPTPPAPPAITQPPRAATPPVPNAPKAAKLAASLGGVPSVVRRNRTLRLRLRLANDGSKATTGRVTVTIAAARGLSVRKRTVRLAALKAGTRRTLVLPVRLNRRARRTTTVAVTVRSGATRARTSVLLRLGRARRATPRRPAPGTPARPANPLVGTYWWRTVSHADYAWDNRALYFVDATTVYSGFPPGGLPPTCATPPAKPGQEVDQREGCLPYTYDAATGAVTIGDKAGTFKDGRLTIDANAYDPLRIADAGARFDVRDLEHTDFSGQCLSWLGCTVSRKFLTLQPDGQFGLSTSTTSSSGDPGQGPFTGVASFPPDQRGTYEVRPGGRIRLAFADGTVREETFAVLTSPTTRQPDPVGEGVMVGKDNFYPDPSPGS